MKLKPTCTLLLMLLLLAGQLNVPAVPVAKVLPVAMAVQGEECGADCVRDDGACEGRCLVTLSCCAQAQAAVLPAALVAGEQCTEPLIPAAISAYHYRRQSSIDHPPQPLFAV